MRYAPSFISSKPMPRLTKIALPLLGGLAVLFCMDLLLLYIIRIGPPAGKGDVYFLELTVLLAAAVVVASVAILASQVARASTPFLYIALAWHTGFQVSLNSGGTFVLTVFDVLVPLSLFLGLLGHWYLNEDGRKAWFQGHWRLLAVFWGFCLWGLVLAIVRDVDPQPMLANLKSLLFYPLILIITPWCIRSWKQLYGAVGLMVALIFERAGDGVRQALTHQVLKFQTLFQGHLIYRIDGDMAATNQYATYLLTGGLILLALITASGLKRWTRLGLLVPLALVALALLLTYSRGAWLGSAVAIVALLFMLRPRQALATLGVFAVIAALIEAVHPGAGSQILSRANDYDHSILTREQYQSIGFAVVEHFPFGAGWGAWFARVPGGVQAVPGFPWYHDDYLQLATEIGVLGLLSMLAILSSIIRAGWKAARNALTPIKGALTAGLCAAFIGMLVQAATDQFLWHADIAPHIWIVGGLLVSAVALTNSDIAIKGAVAEGIDWANANAPPALPVDAENATF